eukprot:1287562-Pyramimonas_sp.AAC.1
MESEMNRPSASLQSLCAAYLVATQQSEGRGDKQTFGLVDQLQSGDNIRSASRSSSDGSSSPDGSSVSYSTSFSSHKPSSSPETKLNAFKQLLQLHKMGQAAREATPAKAVPIHNRVTSLDGAALLATYTLNLDRKRQGEPYSETGINSMYFDQFSLRDNELVPAV